MIAMHPSPSARDGREIEQSRYIKRAEKLDRIIECAQCGFMIDLNKRSTGGSMGAIPSGGASQLMGSGTPPGPGIAFTDTYADPIDTNSGCPFCNTMNPQAKGRGRTGFESPRASIENF